MSTPQITRRSITVASAAVIATVLVIVAVGYPGWAWFPLTISFWISVVAFIAAAGMEIRSRWMRA